MAFGEERIMNAASLHPYPSANPAMASIPVSPPPQPHAGADGPLFETPQAFKTLTPAEGTHSLLAGYLLWILAPLSALIGSGTHRFYYGKKWTGLLWTLTFGLLGVGWLIDAVLMQNLERSADRRYTPGPYDYNIAWLLNGIPFFGIFGIHRFYLGKYVTGVIWLLTG
ncbi:MAG: TM2 domain-containing protein, partial [Planctomycetota bacterium]